MMSSSINSIRSDLKSLPVELISYIRDYVDLNRFNKLDLFKRFTDKPTEWVEYANGLVLLPTVSNGYTSDQKSWIRNEFPLYQAIAYILDDCQGNIDPFLKNCDFARHQSITMIQNMDYSNMNLYEDNLDDNQSFLLDKTQFFNPDMDLTEAHNAIINGIPNRMNQLRAYWDSL